VRGALLVLTACGGDKSEPASEGTDAENNVEFSESCPAPAACGGDPTGNWTLTAGCVNPPDDGFQCADGLVTARGKASGLLYLDGTSMTYRVDLELDQCGRIDRGPDGTTGGGYEVTGSSFSLGVDTVDFCVDGDTLRLMVPSAMYPNLSVLQLTRDSSTGAGRLPPRQGSPRLTAFSEVARGSTAKAARAGNAPRFART